MYLSSSNTNFHKYNPASRGIVKSNLTHDFKESKEYVESFLLKAKRFPEFTLALRCRFFNFLSVYNLQRFFSMGAAICFTFIVLAHQSVYPMNCNLTISRSNLRASVPFAGSNIGSNLTRLAPGTPAYWS